MDVKRVLTFILYMVVMAVTTAYLFLAADRVYDVTFSLGFFLLTYLLLILAFFASIIVHEVGHMVAGLLTGYSFLFIRLFSYAISKEEDGLRFRRFGMPGTGGQCLMIPKEKEDKPFVLYFLGGGIANIAAALLGLWAMSAVPERLGMTVYLFLGFFSILGIGLGATNLIPMVANGIPNDGYHVRLLLEDHRRVEAFYDLQRMTRQLFRGVRPKDLAMEGLARYDELEESDLFRISVVSFQVLHLIDAGELDRAMERIADIRNGIGKAPDSYRLDILQSAFFLESYHYRDREMAEALFSDLERYLLLKRTSEALLALGAYHLCIKGDLASAVGFLEKAEEAAATSPFRGAAEGDMVFIRRLLEKARREGEAGHPDRRA